MPAIPAQCKNPKCRAIYPSGFHLSNSKSITIRGGRSQCPNCGSMGSVADGVFDVTADAIHVLSAPSTTLDMLREIEDILLRAKAGEMKPAEAAERSSAISPQFGSLIKAAGSNLALLALLLAIVQFAYQIWDTHGSSEFERQFLQSQQQIIGLLENQAGDRSGKETRDDGAAPSEPKSAPISIASKPKTDRRAQVNAERRAKLKDRRSAFGGAALLHRFRHRF